MKINLLKLSGLFLVFMNLTGCIATHNGSMFGSASLAEANFTYQKQNVLGEAQTTYVLGFGGMAKNSLILEAKKNMLNGNPLRKNQALANITVSYKTSRFLLFIVTTVQCIVSADIVEFSPHQTGFSQTQNQNTSTVFDENNNSTSNTSIEKQNTVTKPKTPIKVGDEVNIINYFSTPVMGKVIEILKGEYFDEYIVEYVKSNNKVKQVKLIEYQIEK